MKKIWKEIKLIINETYHPEIVTQRKIITKEIFNYYYKNIFKKLT